MRASPRTPRETGRRRWSRTDRPSKAGLRPGDVITALDGTKVADSAELIVAIRSHRPGETVTLTVKRSGDERQIRVTLAATKG